MVPNTPTLADLFAQLGLDANEAAQRAFVAAHAPLPANLPLPDAPFWTPAQATFLREALLEDAEWAEVVDELDALLRKA